MVDRRRQPLRCRASMRSRRSRPSWRRPAPRACTGEPVELAFEEDFAVLDGDTSTLPWLCVCVPSHWAPEDKLGQPFAAVHAPVADNRRCWRPRASWCGWSPVASASSATSGPSPPAAATTSTRGAIRGRPGRTPPMPGIRAPVLPARRAPDLLPHPRRRRQAVFTIRVMLQPLAKRCVIAPMRRLHDALASMSEAVLAYKNLVRRASRCWPGWPDAPDGPSGASPRSSSGVLHLGFFMAAAPTSTIYSGY